jgi:hypothetical protein
MSKTKLSLYGAVLSILPCVLSAGTIITANLPANTEIVNIDGRADGAAAFNASQSLWFHPFNVGNSLLEFTVQPGTYQFRVVNPTDAAALFPSLTAPQLATVNTAWTFNSPFITDYLVFDVAAATNTALSQILAGSISPSAGSGSAAAAYALAKTNGFFNQLIIGDIASGSKVTQFTFSAAETLIFAIPDNLLSDNGGGVSVLISPAATAPAATPEPAAIFLMLAGLCGIYVLQNRRAAGDRSSQSDGI